MHVPGSIFPGTDYPFAWYAIVRNRTTGKERTYWMNGSHVTRETVQQHIAANYRNVEVVTIDRCTSMPTRPLTPVPPEDYEFGYRDAVERFLTGADREAFGPRPIALRPLALKPIALKPLSLRR